MNMKRPARNAAFAALVIVSLSLSAPRCAAQDTQNAQNLTTTNNFQAAQDALRRVQDKFAPDTKMAIFEVRARQESNTVILQGDVDNPAARQAALAAVAAAGFDVSDHITVLPEADLGDRVWGLATKSVINMRQRPRAENTRDMATQAFMGSVLRLWKIQTNALNNGRPNWYFVQTDDDYLSWTDGSSFTPCTKEQAEAWKAAPLLIVTVLEGRILKEPSTNALQVSDVVQCDLVKSVGTEGDWLKVQLPEGTSGYLPKTAAADYAAWRAQRRLTADNLESTARKYLGQPYVWGGISWRGMDCSGFTRMAYYINGMDLHRDAFQQCRQGVEVPLENDLKYLKKGDLLFFGRAAGGNSPERISHVAIYLQDKLFIQDSGTVHISSLDPASPIADMRHLTTLLHARRLLPEP
jgi:cell wall-associated NlpC family hydrolase